MAIRLFNRLGERLKRAWHQHRIRHHVVQGDDATMHKRMVCRHDHTRRNSPHRCAFNVGMLIGTHGEKRVVLARAQSVRPARKRFDGHRGAYAEVSADERRDAGSSALAAVKSRHAQRHVQRKRARRLVRVRKPLQLAEHPQHRRRLRIEALAEQRGAYAAALAHEQIALQLALKIGEGLRHRLHRHALLFGRSRQATVIEYGNEVFDLIDVQITRPDVLAPPFPLSPEF